MYDKISIEACRNLVRVRLKCARLEKREHNICVLISLVFGCYCYLSVLLRNFCVSARYVVAQFCTNTCSETLHC